MLNIFKPITAAAILAVSLLGVSTVFAQTEPASEPSQGTTMAPDMMQNDLMQDGNMMGMMGMMSQMTEMMATCNQMMAMAPQQAPDAPQQPESNGG